MWLNRSAGYKVTLNRLKAGLPCRQVHLRLHNLRHASHPGWKAQIPEENEPNQEGEAGRLATQCQSVRIFLRCWALSLCSVEEEDLQLPFTPGVRGCVPGTQEWQTTLSTCRVDVCSVWVNMLERKGRDTSGPCYLGVWPGFEDRRATGQTHFPSQLRTPGSQGRSGPSVFTTGLEQFFRCRWWRRDGSRADADIILGLSQIVLTFGNWFLKRVLTLRRICLHNTHI